MAKSRQQLSSTANTRQQQQHPNTFRVQKKTLDGFLEKTRPKLTISTTDTSCTSSLNQIPPDQSVECQIPRMPSQHHSMEASVADSFASSTAHDVATLYQEWRTLYGLNTGNSEINEVDEGEGDNTKEEFPIGEKSNSHPDVESQKESHDQSQHHSMEASVAADSIASSTAHDVATLYKEWRSLYGLSSSTGNSEMCEDNKGKEDNAKEEVPSEKSKNHPDVESQKESQAVGQKAIDSPSDLLLSAQYTTESSTDTMKTMILPTHRIQTPIGMTSASCSFNSHFFQFLKSAVQKTFMSQMPGENNGNRVNDGKSDYNYIGDNSSRSYKSETSEERYDEGEAKATMDWTFESSESGSAYSEFS
jgi:hypothetical protein